MFTIYYIKNLITNQYYVGQTSNYDNRMKVHKKIAEDPKTKLQFAIKKYGINNFEFKPIITDIITKEEASELEIKYIELYNSYLDGYNMSKGGESNMFGNYRTEEQKKKISEATKQAMSKPEVKDKMSEFWQNYYKEHTVWNKGIKTGPNHKISESKKGKKTERHISQEELFKICSERSKKVNVDRHWYTNGKEDLRIKSEQIELYTSLGWRKGRSNANCKKNIVNM